MTDIASSLRAAALLSRKRRRVDPALPPRLAQEPSLHLDYGNDDPPEDIEDGQIREEGEISDTETSPPPRRSPTPPPRLRQRPFTSQPQEPMPQRIETPAASPLEPSDAQSWQPEPSLLESLLDAHHVRPGLSMTQDQYNTAKDIVLDLLGWGVPPEYLLECGLSRHVIFYVFSELNLRLPSNLDTSGLIPYPTPDMLALIPVSPSLSTRSLLSSSSTMPPPVVIPAQVSLAERMSMERIDTRMSPDPYPYIKAEPSSPSSVDLNSHSLLIIEQQRRQELLARKAAIASRKARQEPHDFVTPSKDQDQDVDMSAVPTQCVDDFLKSIEPASHLDAGDNDNRSSVDTTSLSSLERMDVDDLIPLNGASRDTSTSSVEPSSAQSTSSSSTAIHADLQSPVELPTGSTDNAGSTSNGSEQDPATSMDMAGSGSLTPTLQNNDGDNNYPQRRSMKRPVAADFVDFDTGPGPSRGHGNSSNGHSNGAPYSNSLSRRKCGSFAGISGMRRCVIELSDSEDDGDNQVRGDYAGNSETREYSPAATTSFATRVPSRLTATPTMPSSMGSTNGNTGQPFPTPPATNALAEKEEEIKRMRQLIAQREESRSKKLAAMSGKSTPMLPPTAEVQAPEGMMTAKQEETHIGTLNGKNSSTLLPSRESENNYTSIPELATRHGISVAMVDGNQDVTDKSATARTFGTPSPTDNRNDLSAQETSTIGSLSRFSASPTAG